MKAIVLSFDPHLEIANLVVETYNRLWTGCPFQFRVPFTDRDPSSIFRAQNIEFIQTAPDIRNTMENLLRDLPDNEFVFWCIDDRYPIEIFEPAVLGAVYDFVSNEGIDVDSVKLTDLRVDGIEGKIEKGFDQQWSSLRQWLKRGRRRFFHPHCEARVKEKTWRQREEATPGAPAFALAGQDFFRQLGHAKNGFYMPQFIKPALLKRFFFDLTLPRLYGIREFHHFLRSAEVEHRSYFPNKFLLSVGESTFRGRLSATCYAQMLKFRAPLPKIAIVGDYKIYSDRGLPDTVQLTV
jgi:hypothetical protein